jgi:hypothetical protein
MAETDVIHLVWKPAGIEPLRRFAESYRRYSAGADHELTVLYNGFGGDDLDPYRSVLEGLRHRELFTAQASLDIAAYFWASRQVSGRFVCFLNSYSELLAAGWLAKLLEPMRQAGVGASGATGSWESVYTAYLKRIASVGRPRSPLGWAKHLMRLRKLGRYRAEFDPLPNPHLRSNAFVIERARWLGLRRPALRTKWETLQFENGKQSMSRQLQGAGLELYVVGRDGTRYASDQWPMSRTFRMGNQENLLVADNRTRQYEKADEESRRHMREIAWGEP